MQIYVFVLEYHRGEFHEKTKISSNYSYYSSGDDGCSIHTQCNNEHKIKKKKKKLSSMIKKISL